jgi:DNA-binding response OmpR family regulator
MLATQAFDVVVSDFNMPGPSGLEFLNRIRQDHREMILVLITAYGTDALEEGVRQLGVGYITKPFEPSSLVQIITAWPRRRNRDGTARRHPDPGPGTMQIWDVFVKVRADADAGVRIYETATMQKSWVRETPLVSGNFANTNVRAT